MITDWEKLNEIIDEKDKELRHLKVSREFMDKKCLELTKTIEERGHAFQETQNRTLIKLSQTNQALDKAVEGLENYGTHDKTCILARWCAGEPTVDGGYRMKFGDKWYQTRPVDETPKCECGFDETLESIKVVKNNKGESK